MASDLRRVQPGIERSEIAKERSLCPQGRTGGCGQMVALELERRMESRNVIRILDEAVIARG